MGYRDDLIRRLKDDRTWDSLPTHRRAIFESMTDELAGSYMAWLDEEEPNHQGKLDALSRPETSDGKRVATEMMASGAINMCEVFGGGLVHYNEGIELSPLGRALADFFQMAEDAGFPLFNTVNHLGNITPESALCIVKLAQQYPDDGQ